MVGIVLWGTTFNCLFLLQSSTPPSSPKSAKFADNQTTKQHKTHKNGGGSNTIATSHHAKKTHKVSNDVDPADCDEKDENEGGRMVGEEESQYTVPHHHRYAGDLSPVQESPEYKSEELNYKELEKDLNLALSRLSSEMSELQVDEEVRAESVETQITHTVTVTNTQQLSAEKEEEEEEEGLFQGALLLLQKSNHTWKGVDAVNLSVFKTETISSKWMTNFVVF